MADWGEEFRNPGDGYLLGPVVNGLCDCRHSISLRGYSLSDEKFSQTPPSLPNSMHSITDLIVMHIYIAVSL